jgi:integrase
MEKYPQMARQSTPGKLSAIAVKQAKPKDKPYKLSDGAGLYLLINPNGSKYWRLKYRLYGKEKTFAVGVYPTVSLADARRDALDAKRMLVSEGVDPTIHRKQEKARKADIRFRIIADNWHKKESGRWSADHADRVWQTLKTDAFPLIGDTPVDQITAQDALGVIRKIEARGALDVAARVKQRMSAVFRYAIYTGKATINPVDSLKDVIQSRKVTHRRSVPIGALPNFLRDLENYKGYDITKLALKLLVLTFVRPGELRGAQWKEFNLKQKEWRIPAERMKMKAEHIVPLSNQAVEVLKEVRGITGKYDYVFPGSHDWRKPMSENTLNYGIQKRMGYDATAHGFRTVASTVLNETGFRMDVIERQLAHAERNKVRAAYNKAQHLAERREMMQWWADHLDTEREGGKVIAGKFGVN